jgi:hypothetical protein
MDTAQILTELRAQRDRTIKAIAALEALNGTVISPSAPGKTAAHVGINGDKTASVAPAATKRVVSPEARQRMAEAQKKRYAKAKRAVKAAAKKTAAVAPVATKSAKTAAATSPVTKKVGKPMSEATKKKLAAAAKARWAAKKPTAKKVAKKAALVDHGRVREAPMA